MKLRTHIKMLWRKNSTKYGMVGALCLLMAAMLFTLNIGGQARAAEVVLGATTIDLEMENGAYLIQTPEHLAALGTASAAQTQGKKFVLANDITADIVSRVANGSFAGEFDGQGHVITITSVSFPDSAEWGEMSQGVIFGTITGKVKNFIVDIQGDVNYTRTSGVARTDTSVAETVTLNGEEAQPSCSGGDSFSVYSTDEGKKNLASWLDAAGTVITASDGKTYRREAVSENIIKTTTYELGEAGTDQFGILCGTLAENASISQVYVKGSSLNVTQEAVKMPTKTTLEGVRDRYFYYRVDVKDLKKDDPASIAASEDVTASVRIYNSAAGASVSNGDANVKLEVEAPEYVEKGGELSYKIKISNERSDAVTIESIGAAVGALRGTWKDENGNAITDGEKKIAAGEDKIYQYTLQDAVTGDVTVGLKVTYSYVSTTVSGGDPLQQGFLSCQNVTTKMVDTTAAVAGDLSGTGLLVSLTPGRTNYLTDTRGTANVEYTLQIKNNVPIGSADKTELKIQKSGIDCNGITNIIWKNQSGGDFSEIVLSTGEEAVLTGTVALQGDASPQDYSLTVKVTPSDKKVVYENVNTYSYVPDITQISDLISYGEPDYSGNQESDMVADTDTGNHLNAGIFAGTSRGSITECKQEMEISGTQLLPDIAELRIGGAVGQAVGNASASHLYLLKESSYDGENSALPEGSAIAATASVPTSDGKWSSYEKAAPTGGKDVLFDLSWLVKANADFSYAPVDDNHKVAVSYAGTPMTEEALSYSIGYNARKSMTETSETSSYVTYDGALDLGDSGFYRLLNIYATDGYYHYTTPYLELTDAAWVYPYADPVTSNPYIFEDEDISVVRLLNPLRDVVCLLQTALADGTQSGVVYYNVNSSGSVPTGSSYTATIAEDGTVQLLFDETDVKYQIVQVIDGHIYPTQETRSVTQAERQSLPKPKVTVYDYYNEDEVKNPYVDFAVDGFYEAGTDMKIEPVLDGGNEANYSFRYAISTTAPVSGEWNDEQKYIGNSSAFMNNAVAYTGSAAIPEALENISEVYLYVEISRKNYDAEIYYYGPFAVTAKNEVTSMAFANGEAVLSEMITDGDKVFLSGAPQGTTIQYMVSDTAVSAYSWLDYNDNGIVMTQSEGGYLYARIYYGNGKYSSVFPFHYTFSSTCTSPRVTPNTGLSSDGEPAAALVGSGTTVYLNNRTADSDMFYLLSDASQTINLERVSVLPTDITEDGTIGSDGYKYFKVGTRWYRTTFTELERYTEGIILSHDKKDKKLMYLSTVAVADGYQISQILEYVYKVEEKQQVMTPEATLETRYMPGNEENEIVAIASGSNLSFFTVTPEAELFYAIGSNTSTPFQPVPSDGIPVVGDYNTNFMVRVQAKKEGMLDSNIITFIYTIAEQETTSAPTATPGTTQDVPAVVIPGNKILLSSATKEASIYYTTDGSAPQIIEETEGVYASGNAATLLYDANVGIVMPLDGEGFFTIHAVAVKSGLAKSQETRFIYAYPDLVQEPYTNIESGEVELNTAVCLKNLTEGATIYYTVAYGNEIPENPTLSSSVFSEEYPFVITQKTHIKAMAAKDGVKSSIVTFDFEPLEQLNMPQPTIESGSVVSRGTILGIKAAEGATIYYTMDGSDPTDSANTAVMSGGSLLLNGEPGDLITIKAYAVAADKSRSEVGTFTYQFSQNNSGISASIESGSLVSYGTKVNLMSDITGADIYYTTDGSSPVERGTKGTAVEINGTPGNSYTVKAVAVVNGVPGIMTTFIYRIKEKPEAPIASPAGGILTVATRVSLNSGAHKIYYTTDGTEPTKSSNLYSEPVLINKTTVLKAIAISEDGEVSDIASFLYKAAKKAEAPTSNQEDAGVLEPGTKVLLDSETRNATIYYTLDGTEPSLERLDSLLVYDHEGIEINRSVTIKAVAYREDLQLSDIATWSYFVEVIPAVERKEEEAAKQAEKGLHDTGTGELPRDNRNEEALSGSCTIKDEAGRISVTFTGQSTQNPMVLVAKEEEAEYETVRTTKQLFGEDYTILSCYYMWLEANSSFTQVEGEVEVGIPIPEGYENATLTIVQVSGGNKIRALNTRRTDGMLYAKTGSVSKYAVVGPERLEESKEMIPYLLILEMAAGITLTGGVIFFAIEKIKKIGRNRKDYPNE